jgi:hypothetical protein
VATEANAVENLEVNLHIGCRCAVLDDIERDLGSQRAPERAN